MQITRLFTVLMLFSFSVLFAQNPIVPPGLYIADPSAHVWSDGKLYVYGSLDESTSYYCSWRHHVLSTSDMKTWTIHEDRFASKGPNDEVSGTDALLFAPDCMVKDNTYYLYYCLPDRNYAEGVATSDNPAGPFRNGQKIDLGGYNQIDPSTFIDDDGQIYYLWGQFTLKMAKMNPDMKTLDLSTLRDSVLTESRHFFHEGAFLTKRNGIYYLIYADMSRVNVPSSIGYATSDSPMGPYRYGGVIVDNDRCDPGNWNNHGSIAEFNGQWYVFYHRATHNSRMMRKACVEPIHFNADGSIDEVEMTSQGSGPPLNAFSKIDAERACLLFGNVRIQQCGPDNEELGNIRHGDSVAYKYLDFADGATSVRVRIKPGRSRGKLDMALDQPWHPSITTLDIGKSDSDKTMWQILEAPVEGERGIHALWLRFTGERDTLFSVDWIQFQ